MPLLVIWLKELYQLNFVSLFWDTGREGAASSQGSNDIINNNGEGLAFLKGKTLIQPTSSPEYIS